MTNDEARFLVTLALRATGRAVIYEGRSRIGQRAIPDLVVMDPDTGATSRLRVMVGKRPRPKSPLYIDQRRVGVWADSVAVVDGRTGGVSFRHPTPVTGR